jgi:uncharacterized phiE125 gp8 family phage protein
MLIDLSPPAVRPEQVGELASQLRLPAAYADEPEGAARLERFVEAAMALAEKRTRRVLLARSFEYRLAAWPSGDRVALPVAPVSAIEAVGVRSVSGEEVTLTGDLLRVDALRAMPEIVIPAPSMLPLLSDGDTAFVRFVAGYGANWTDVPADLRLAVMMIGAALHDHGMADPEAVQMPFGALALLEGYRRVRL